MPQLPPWKEYVHTVCASRALSTWSVVAAVGFDWEHFWGLMLVSWRTVLIQQPVCYQQLPKLALCAWQGIITGFHRYPSFKNCGIFENRHPLAPRLRVHFFLTLERLMPLNSVISAVTLVMLGLISCTILIGAKTLALWISRFRRKRALGEKVAELPTRNIEGFRSRFCIFQVNRCRFAGSNLGSRYKQLWNEKVCRASVLVDRGGLEHRSVSRDFMTV